jgi:hypothetical protein
LSSLYFKYLCLGIFIAFIAYKIYDLFKEVALKKFFMMLEEVWVAAAFAEAGVYDALIALNKPRIRFQKINRLRSESSC